MMFIPCILICFVFGYGVCSELNGTRVIHRESEEHGVFHCIPRICPKNFNAILCEATDPANPGKDECMPCDKNKFYPKETNTSTFKSHIQLPMDVVCRKPDCNCGHEGFLVNEHDCNVTGAQKICICNANIGYCGDDYRKCDKRNKSDIPVDWRLTPNCSIKKCEEGYSKPYVGYGACEEDTNNSTTTQPTTPFTSGGSTTDVQNNSTEVDTTTPSVNEDKDGGLDLNILIIAVSSLASLAVIILGVWLGIKLCCRNKFGQFIQRLKNTVPNNGVNNRLNEIPEEQDVNAEPSEDTSMV